MQGEFIGVGNVQDEIKVSIDSSSCEQSPDWPSEVQRTTVVGILCLALCRRDCYWSPKLNYRRNFPSGNFEVFLRFQQPKE